MQSFGKTCLIKCNTENSMEKQDGIFVMNSIDPVNDIFWKGEIINYGTLVDEKDLEDLPPVGTKVVVSYGKESSDKGGTKLVFGKSVYYIRDIKEILGVLE